MSKWFFQKSKIANSLPLALVTHNPVQMFVNLYIISYTCIKYKINYKTIYCLFALLTLYFPALIWEISRKIKAPKDENDYVTYSKLFGYKKATRFIMLITIIDIITNFVLVFNLNKISVLILLALVLWMCYKFVQYMKNPYRFKIVEKVEIYSYLQETTMILTILFYIVFGKI